MRVNFNVNLPDHISCVGCQQMLGSDQLVDVRWDRVTSHFVAVFACPGCFGLTSVTTRAGSAGKKRQTGAGPITDQELEDFDRQFATGDGQRAFLAFCRDGGEPPCHT